jgi:REP element-mobilizing transposase RayT
MPRANRHFLPGHVTPRISSNRSSRSTAALRSSRGSVRSKRSRRSIAALRSSRLADGQNSTAFGMRDRRRYLHWLFEAKKRFGLSVLNYMITSNHVHLLIKDTGPNVIADSMQLIAGRTAQEYNQRKDRQGAFWEDRYHATAIEADEHLHRCLIYIDLNMVRAIEY